MDRPLEVNIFVEIRFQQKWTDLWREFGEMFISTHYVCGWKLNKDFRKIMEKEEKKMYYPF